MIPVMHNHQLQWMLAVARPTELSRWTNSQDLNMQTTIYIGLAFLMGTIMSIYLPMNSSVSKHVGSPITANVTFFIVALITSIILFFIFGNSDTIGKVKDVPLFLYLTGVITLINQFEAKIVHF